MPFGRAARASGIDYLGLVSARMTAEERSRMGITVAARATVAGLEPSRYQVVYCANPTIGGRGLLSLLVAALGGVPYTHRAILVPRRPRSWPPLRPSADAG